MNKSKKYANSGVMLKFNEKRLKRKLYALEHKEDDDEIVIAKDDGQVHVNWATELKEIIDTEELSLNCVADHKISKSKNWDVCPKSILKDTTSEDDRNNFDTDVSSDYWKFDDKPVKHTWFKKPQDKSEMITELCVKDFGDKASYRYPNKKFLAKILGERNKKKKHVFD